MGLRPSGRQVFRPQPDEAPDVVGKIGEPDLHAGSREADRADGQMEQTLLMRKHMLDGAANLRLLSIGNARTLRHGLALWLLAVNARYEPASFQHRLVSGRAISRVRPHLTGCIVAVENVLQSRPVVSGGMRRCPFADQPMRTVDRDMVLVAGMARSTCGTPSPFGLAFVYLMVQRASRSF